jgi:hypothetical protein
MPPMEPAPAATLIDGRYRVMDVLGQGSFARTLACEDLSEEQRRVAIKQLRVQGVGDWKPVELFEREAKVLASLRHHGVPEIFRHFEGRDPEGQLCLYLVMELVDGPSLRHELQAKRTFSDLELTELGLSLLDILDYLHSRRPPVFHRDIKPSNIVLRASGAPVLVDFGGVCQGWRPAEGGSTVTGTFGYMPAEQLMGQVSAASDLYALGATLLHLITGREPTDFSFESGRLNLPAEATVRPGLRRFVNALLAPAPRDRPTSARAARRLLLEEAAAGIVEEKQATQALAGLIEASCALARTLQPATVILEDVDLIAQERTREGGACTPLLFELLNQMDGLAEDADVLFLLTSNRPDLLEPALAARPGRIDQAIEIPSPDAGCRRRLLELYGQGLTLRLEKPDSLVARTEGASAAFMRELIRKATLFAADEGPPLAVTDRHFAAALHELLVEGGELTRSLLGVRAEAPART